LALDDHIRLAIDRAMTGVRASLEETLRSLAETIAAEARSADTRLAAALQSFDKARSLGELLNTLGDTAGLQADRSAVLIVGPDGLAGWRWSGFGGGAADAKALILSLNHGGIAGVAVRRNATIFRLASGAANTEADLPPFAEGAGERDAAALPIVLGGTVAAVLYVDAAPAAEAPPPWVAPVELLARHAGFVLEAMTARYLTGTLPEPASEAVPMGGHILREAKR